MAWINLLIAGLAEVWWATTMKMSDGFSKLNYTLLTVVGMLVSFFFLIRATKELPLSIAYPVWTGIGAVGAILVGVILFREQLSLLTWLFVILLVIGIIGIKVTSGH
ncbi:QacE family quaternary ammonium compound efflux SMR transporter [Lactobacillus curvatus]|nr:QacE family quaternary ammonium compound efflux SMR transporter [Latilactobacillus curvatus]MSE23691.1 QacE family quaternary ammonium compound efflux SMR transporter [Latilactobacillus curvatus]